MTPHDHFDKPEEQLPLLVYLKQALRRADGRAWVLTCVAAALSGIDLFFGLGLVPLREVAKPSKASVLLISSPLLVFLVMVTLRQLPFSRSVLATWIRAAFCVSVFLILNF